MSEAAVGRRYHKELAREKARIYGRPTKTQPSALEIAAQQWQGGQKPAKQPPPPQKQVGAATRVADAQAATMTQPTPPARAGWVQFNPWRTPDQEPQKPRTVSTITIFCLAKKIMAQEWRRAKGIKKRDPRVAEMEKFASEYQGRKIAAEQEKRRQAMQLKKEHDKILECLDRFVEAMLDKRQRKRISSLEQVGELLAEAFRSLAEVFEVEWAEDGGCAIWLEPWPERRARRARGDARPALRRIGLDAKLNISAYEPVTDPVVWQEKRADLLLRPLRLSKEDRPRLRTPEEARDFLADRAGEVGRVLSIASENGLWKIRIQPWDEVRVRNLSKSGKGPITEYELTVSKDFQDLSCKHVED